MNTENLTFTQEVIIALIAALGGVAAVLIKVLMTHGKALTRIEMSINGRLTELIEAIRGEATARGHAQGRADQQASDKEERDKERGDTGSQ